MTLLELLDKLTAEEYGCLQIRIASPFGGSLHDVAGVEVKGGFVVITADTVNATYVVEDDGKAADGGDSLETAMAKAAD